MQQSHADQGKSGNNEAMVQKMWVGFYGIGAYCGYVLYQDRSFVWLNLETSRVYVMVYLGQGNLYEYFYQRIGVGE